jgi:PTS system nitrogen regulatory IIA component
MSQAGDDPIANMRDDQVIPELGTVDLSGVLNRLGDGLAAGEVGGPPASAFAAALRAREDAGSTALGAGVAVPHCRIPGLRSARIAIGRSREGVPCGAADGEPVRLFVALAVPAEAPSSHLRLLSEVARRLRGAGRVERLLAAGTAAEIRAEFTEVQPLAGVR